MPHQIEAVRTKQSSDSNPDMAAATPVSSTVGTTAVFVYGTLKRGCFNHHILRRCLENAGPTRPAVYATSTTPRAVGTVFETVHRFPLVLKPARHVPALIPQPGAGHHVEGEVYYCDPEALQLLDELEEIATHKYTREAVRVRPVAPAGESELAAATEELDCQAYFISEEEAERSGLPPASAWPSLGPADGCLRSYADPRYVFQSGAAESGSRRGELGIRAPKCVVFCDFDGTISVSDTLDVLIDAAMGEAARVKIDQQYEGGEISFRELLRRELSPLSSSFNQGCSDIATACRKLQEDAGQPVLGTGVVDPAFCPFTRMCHDAGVPLVILSGGMTQLVQRFVTDAFSAESPLEPPTAEMLRKGQGLPAGAIPVRANSLMIDGEAVPLDSAPGAGEAHDALRGPWSVEFFDESESGNDKAAAVSAWKPTGTKLIFIGDGVSGTLTHIHLLSLVLPCCHAYSLYS